MAEDKSNQKVKYKKRKSDQKTKYQKSDDIVNFGYVKGMTIGDVIKNEHGFILWAKRNVKGFKLGKKILEEYDLNPNTYK